MDSVLDRLRSVAEPFTSIGRDKEGRKYWFFERNVVDPQMLFTEENGPDGTKWTFYSTINQVKQLIESLTEKGIREGGLKHALTKQVFPVFNTKSEDEND